MIVKSNKVLFRCVKILSLPNKHRVTNIPVHLLSPVIKYFSISGIEINMNSLGITREGYTFTGVAVADLLDCLAC